MKLRRVYLSPHRWELNPDMGPINPKDIKYVSMSDLPKLEAGMERFDANIKLGEWPTDEALRRVAAEGLFLKVEENAQKRYGIQIDMVNIIRTSIPPISRAGEYVSGLYFYVDVRI